MPELSDILVYVDAIGARIRGGLLEATEVRSPPLLRTYEPPLRACDRQRVLEVSRTVMLARFRFSSATLASSSARR